MASFVRTGTIAAMLFLASSFAAPGAFARGFYPWTIAKTQWSAADEEGFSRFVQALGESDCSSSENCIRSDANPYRSSDPNWFDVDLDCAKWPYFLRAYYAWKNHLPFSYVDAISGDADLKYGSKANRPVSRQDIVDHGGGIDGPETIYTLVDTVFSATYRTDANQKGGMQPDFYSPAIGPQSIRPGSVVYDTNGHVGIVYEVDDDGRIHYMDAHPDFTVTRSVYGGQFGQSPERLGGGFKNWRPQELVHAHQDGEGHWIGGHEALAENSDIPDFSLVQYRGNEPNPKGGIKNARFAFNGIELGFYEYVRAAVSGGKVKYNPVFELRESMRTLCNDLKDRAQYVDNAISENIQNKEHPERLPDNIYGTDENTWESYSTPSRDARTRAEVVQFRKDLGDMIEMWIHRDPRIVYDGQVLKTDLSQAYDEESARCTITYLDSASHPVTMDLDSMIGRLFRMSFDPYQCIERRWGATGAEAQSCQDGREKEEWYEAEQRLRNVTDPDYQADMAFSLEDLKREKAGSGVDTHPDVNIEELINDMGDQVAFSGMVPVGR